MTRTVNGEHLFKDREKEVLRKMLWQVADFCGVEVLTYCVLSNHFHVLARFPVAADVPDKELLRRYRTLYPKPTKHRSASIAVMEAKLAAGGEEAEVIRRRLLCRMGDVSEFMKTLKQRFSVWYNRSHERFGTLWAERFRSVLVEGQGNPLQTMAAYIDLNSVRAGIVGDPKDYRFCGYAEAIAHSSSSHLCLRHGGEAHSNGSGPAEPAKPLYSRWTAREGIRAIWGAYADGTVREMVSVEDALRMHRELIFGKRAGEAGLPEKEREKAIRVLEKGGATLPRATVLRCRVRYFTEGAIFGSREFVEGFRETWQTAKHRKNVPRAHVLRGADWGDLATIRGVRKRAFG